MTELDALWEQRFGAGVSAPGVDSPDPEETEIPETTRLLLQHRTHRQFRPDPIPDATLQTILGCGFSAPSKSDLQQASAVVIDDAELRNRIADLIPAMPWIRDCAAFVILLADGYRIEQICEQRGKPFANDNLDNFLAAVSDASLVLQNCIVAAEAHGLGCCPISVIRDHMAAVGDLLDLPERVIPLAGLCLGYPVREGFVSMRLPLEVTVHRNTYDAGALAAGLAAYDVARDARFSIPEDRQKRQGDYGIATFYGWTEDKARQMSKQERGDVGDYARGHGFSLV